MGNRKNNNRYESVNGRVGGSDRQRRTTSTYKRKHKKGKSGLNVRIEKKYIVGALGVAFIALFAVYVNGVVFYTSHFFKGTLINGIEVSKMTVDKLQHTIKDYKLTISERGKEKSDVYIETLKASDIDMEIVSAEGIDRIVKEQNQFLWFIKSGEEHEEKQFIDYDEEKLIAEVGKLKGVNTEYADKPVNASISEYNNGYTIVEEKQGNFLNKSKTLACLKNSISKLEEKVDLDIQGCYRVPKISSDSEKLVGLLDKMNLYAGTTITYNFDENQEVIDGSLISQWLIVDKFKVSIDKEKVDEFVEKIRKEYDTIFSNRDFKTTYGNTVKVEGGDYGWWLNTPQESKDIIELIQNGTSGERTPAYYQTAASHGENDYGDSYVEINLTSQHLFVYKDGEKVLETDFVSGNTSLKRGTNTGTYGITYKERYSKLVGETYESTVSYWMPFDEDIGMHDAIWKTQFGSDFYKTDGSHGCINLPYLTAKKIYDYVEKGTPVIVYKLDGTESSSVTKQSAEEIAQAAIEAIDAIGNVTKNSGKSIENARYMYNKINSEAKKYVNNYNELQEAEEQFKKYE